ncbi:hypothetical protein C2G38_2228030 [Gigaspora rosea]|uniref:HAT C-terminal dimerisation domain-containing protein n=1 Tax=Gigaspora rosea TaxID=44941 RepID=A0A397TWT9_9GLOM|nr:hypothetical protein C2G38_2228030 [Gigaspora rosea]
MLGDYTCDYLLRTGDICGRTCHWPEGCHEHWKARKHFPCKVCNTPNFRHEESLDDDSDDSEFDTSDLTDDSFQIIKSICHTIYNSLFDYWNKPLMIGLLASLLDSRLKTLSSWDEETQERAKAELTQQFKNIATEQTTASIYTTSSNTELECYLDPTQTPIAKDNTNPFEWWAIWQPKFPNVAKSSRKYS